MKKIAFLLNDLCMGGAERCVVLLAKELALAGHEVSLVLLRGSENFWGEMPKGIKIIDASAHFLHKRFWRWWQILRSIAKAQDILIASNILFPTYMMVLLGIKHPCRLIAWVHGPMAEIHAATPFGFFHQVIGRMIYRRLKKIVFVSKQARESMASWLKGTIQPGWEVIPNFLAPLSTNPHVKHLHSPLALLFVGRVSKEKLPLLLIDTVFHLVQKGVPVKLTIVGDGEMLPSLQAQVEKQDLTEYVEFAGRQINVDAYMNAADILLLPSQFEGCPLVILEALQRGLPVIASRVGGVPEILGPLSHRLSIENLDADLMSKAIIESLDDYAAFSLSCLQRSEAFTPKSIMPKWQELIGV